MVSPPSWRIATSNDTRVRVEGRSKIIASVLPVRGLAALWPPDLILAFIARAPSIIARRSAAGTSIRSRKCRTSVIARASDFLFLGVVLRMRAVKRGTSTVEPGDTFGNFLLVDNQWRQQAHDVIAGGDRDDLLRAQRIDEFACGNHGAQSHQQAFAAQFG